MPSSILYIMTWIPIPGADPDRLLRLLEDCQELKYFIRTAKLLLITLQEQSNI